MVRPQETISMLTAGLIVLSMVVGYLFYRGIKVVLNKEVLTEKTSAGTHRALSVREVKSLKNTGGLKNVTANGVCIYQAGDSVAIEFVRQETDEETAQVIVHEYGHYIYSRTLFNTLESKSIQTQELFAESFSRLYFTLLYRNADFESLIDLTVQVMKEVEIEHLPLYEKDIEITDDQKDQILLLLCSMFVNKTDVLKEIDQLLTKAGCNES